MDHDTYSAGSLIGSVTIDLNTMIMRTMWTPRESFLKDGCPFTIRWRVFVESCMCRYRWT